MKVIDLSGQTFGKLTVIKLDHVDKKRGAYWQCSCDCGSDKISVISRSNIIQGGVLSCGCLIKENGLKKRDDLLGKVFGKLTVFGLEIDDKHRLIWLCSCSCGNDKVVKSVGAELKNGHIKSCGCFRAKRLPFGESAFNKLYSTYRRRTLKNGFSFDLSKEKFKEITSQNCFYCDIEPKQIATGNERSYGHYVYNGVDRIDSSKGYSEDNVVPCCGQCNVAKNNYTYEEFITWAERLYKNFSYSPRVYEKLESLKQDLVN